MGIIGKAPVSNASFGNPARVYQQVVPVSMILDYDHHSAFLSQDVEN